MKFEINKNIVLIGMPGAGKSTVGVILAKMLGFTFTDTDIVIQDKTKKLLSEIIKEKGPEGFLNVENEILSGITLKNSVIATGGSAVFGADAMKNLKENGIFVYLYLPYEKIADRLSDIKNRGVVFKEGESLYDIYNERKPLYEKYADITIDETGLGIEETIRETIKKIGEYSN